MELLAYQGCVTRDIAFQNELVTASTVRQRAQDYYIPYKCNTADMHCLLDDIQLAPVQAGSLVHTQREFRCRQQLAQ